MSGTLDVRFKARGTRFLIYPQPRWLSGFSKPVIVYLDAAAGTIKAGPEDDRIYVVDAVEKDAYYDDGRMPPDSGRRPPYTGAAHYPPAQPDARGHFDHIKPEMPTFYAATVFATVRCVLATWEQYFGRQLPWFFRRTYRRLELIPRANSNSSWSRYGYIECGFPQLPRRSKPDCTNFDVVAHEVGHTILKEVIGYRNRRPLAYRAFEEASADLVAIVSSLHFDSVVRYLLEHTKGNLFSANLLSRIGDLSKTWGGRTAFNNATMSHVKNLPDPDKYDLAEPFTGATFDIFVEIYEDSLIERGAIPKELGDRSGRARRRREIAKIQREFRREFKNKKKKFKDALVESRDYFGRLLARTWDKTSINDFANLRDGYSKVATNMIRADAELSGARYSNIIRKAFQRRKILRASSR